MLSTDRQTKLNPMLAALREISGITNVTQDDFDSVSVRVFLELDDCNSRGGSFDGRKPYRFLRPIQEIKSVIKQALSSQGLRFQFVKWPILKYISQRGQKVKDGYDASSITIDIFV